MEIIIVNVMFKNLFDSYKFWSYNLIVDYKIIGGMIVCG